MRAPSGLQHVAKRLEAVGISDVGRVRVRNEDAFAVEPTLGLAVVADGMGGHPAGDVASALAVAELAASLREPEHAPASRGTQIESRSPGVQMAQAVERANDRILAEGDADPRRAGMGTTLTALRVSALTGEFTLAHVGDSRAYLFSEGTLRQLTRDHTWVQDMVDDGKLSEEATENHPLRHVLSRALGIGSPVRPEVINGRCTKGDLFLLCTDGLVGMVPDCEIQRFLSAYRDEDLDGLARGLIGLANENGGADNITVVLVAC